MDWTRRKFTPEEEREIMTRHMQFYRWMLVLMVCVHADPQVEQPKLCLLFRGSRGVLSGRRRNTGRSVLGADMSKKLPLGLARLVP